MPLYLNLWSTSINSLLCYPRTFVCIIPAYYPIMCQYQYFSEFLSLWIFNFRESWPVTAAYRSVGIIDSCYQLIFSLPLPSRIKKVILCENMSDLRAQMRLIKGQKHFHSWVSKNVNVTIVHDIKLNIN